MLQTALAKSTSLQLTLAGVTTRIKQIIVPNVIRTNNNNPKGALEKMQNAKTPEYPQGWWRINNMAIDTEITPSAKNIGRFGSGWTLSKGDGEGATNAIVHQNHYFPIRIDATLTLRSLKEDVMFTMLQSALIASATEMMSFEVETSTTKWTVRVLIEGNNIPIPNIDDLDNSTAEAGMLEVELPINIRTKIGFNLEKAKINNLGEVMTGFTVDNHNGES